MPFSAFFVDTWSSLVTVGYLYQTWDLKQWPYIAFAGFLGLFHLSSFLGVTCLWRLPRLPRMKPKIWSIICVIVFTMGALVAALANHASSWAIYMFVAGLFRPETVNTLDLFTQLDIKEAVFRQLVSWKELAVLTGVFSASYTLTFMFEFGKDARSVFALCQTFCLLFHGVFVLLAKDPLVVQDQQKKWTRHVSQLGVTAPSHANYDKLIDAIMGWAFVNSACNFALLTYLITALLSIPSETLLYVPITVFFISLCSWAGAFRGAVKYTIHDTSPIQWPMYGFTFLGSIIVLVNIIVLTVFGGTSYYLAISHAVFSMYFSSIHSTPLVFLYQVVHKANSAHMIYSDRYTGAVYLGRAVGIAVSWFCYVWLDVAPYIMCIIGLWFYYNRLQTAWTEWKATRFTVK